MRRLLPTAALVIMIVLGSSCTIVDVVKHHHGTNGDGSVATTTCAECVDAADCGGSGACVQIDSDDACAATCATDDDCADTELCQAAIDAGGADVSVCIPATGSCKDNGGCNCSGEQTCDPTTGTCIDPSPTDNCGTLVGPDVPAECHSCNASTDCQANGCYGGWFCDTDGAHCRPPPDGCGDDGAGDVPDAGPITGSVAVGGGNVSRLFFAVVGDTRPPDINQTADYPDDVINQIYTDINALDPKPQFVLATGDYMFSSKNGDENVPQLDKYVAAMHHYSGGPVFPTLGNHECTGYTRDNCATSSTANLAAYKAALTEPLGLDLFYSVPFTGPDWTAKLVVVACNAWSDTQKSWLVDQLAQPTTYTIVARHEPSSADTAPCIADVDAVLAGASYDLLLVGHTHTFSHSGKQVVVGNGGAPITGSAPYGFGLVEMIPGVGFRISEMDAATNAPTRSFVIRP